MSSKSTISDSDLLAKQNPYCMSTFSSYPCLFSSMQYLLGLLMGRLPQPFKNLSVHHPIKIRFAFPPWRGRTFLFVLIFAMVLMILCFGLSHSCSSIPILAPSWVGLKTPRILFQSCGGTQLTMLFPLREWCFGWDWPIVQLKMLDFWGHVKGNKREGWNL